MFKVIDEVCTPTKGTKYSACIDLYAREKIVIRAGETTKIPLGICIDMDKIALKICDDYPKVWNKYEQEKLDSFLSSHYLQLMLRSSLGLKGLTLPNGVGIIDMDYKDEICAIVHYLGDSAIFDDHDILIDNVCIHKGDRIAQIMLCEHKTDLLGIKSNTKRIGGFGSTN